MSHQGGKPAEAADEAYVTLRDPPPLAASRGRDLIVGIELLPVQRLAAFSDDQLEIVVSHWLHETLRARYAHVVEYAGSGDKGRDRAGFEGEIGTDPWDNYQCKQYGHKLMPSDLWLELGKIVYYVTADAYSCPRRYSFVAPRGFGPKALDLLASPEAIRDGLARNWDDYCSSLCGYKEIADALSGFVFPAFDPIGGQRIVDDLDGTAVYARLFGGGLTKPRPPDAPPPTEIAPIEMPYIRQLVAAYDDHAGGAVVSVDTALGHAVYGRHLRGSRREFYCAESLREFSKDVLIEQDAFGSLQDQMLDGVKFTAAQAHASGYDRALATCAHATSVELGDHPLAPELKPADRSGMCHQLVNDDRLRWVP
ncbi:MAG TPA: ABC-three component system protein [Solirubrobacteraceae bacterium]|nr:ABC-three component system protein [Solirubrobacteraceae bacterium]